MRTILSRLAWLQTLRIGYVLAVAKTTMFPTTLDVRASAVALASAGRQGALPGTA
jgi:hypothetical protein